MIRAVLTRPLFADLGLLVLRVLTGALLIHHGYEKLANIENFADAFVRPLHLPFPIVLSYVAAFSEVIGSWLLITGLLTRVGAAAIAGTITVAIYTPSLLRVSTFTCSNCWAFIWRRQEQFWLAVQDFSRLTN